MEFEKTLAAEFFGNSLEQYSSALIFYIICLLFVQFVLPFLFRRLSKIASQTNNDFDDIIVQVFGRIPKSLYAFFFLLITLKFFLHLEDPVIKPVNGLLLILVVLEITRLAQALAFFFLRDSAFGKNKTSLQGVKLIVKILLWVTAFLLILSNLGFNISALAASLGIGGIAIALALQNVLGDLFASFTIYFDKPFQVGDYIIIANTDGNGTQGGVVQKIGLKTTRIKTLQGEELVVSNKELTETRVRNFKQLDRRRVVFSVGVTYDTPSKKVEKIPGILQQVIEDAEEASLLRVHFKEFGAFSLNFEIVYYVESSDYNDYMDVQQNINFRIMKVFEKEKIEIAFPTQTLYMKKAD